MCKFGLALKFFIFNLFTFETLFRFLANKSGTTFRLFFSRFFEVRLLRTNHIISNNSTRVGECYWVVQWVLLTAALGKILLEFVQKTYHTSTNSFRPWIISAHFGIRPNSKKNSFRGNYSQKFDYKNLIFFFFLSEHSTKLTMNLRVKGRSENSRT